MDRANSRAPLINSLANGLRVRFLTVTKLAARRAAVNFIGNIFSPGHLVLNWQQNSTAARQIDCWRSK
jgi:hypothetical protein